MRRKRDIERVFVGGDPGPGRPVRPKPGNPAPAVEAGPGAAPSGPERGGSPEPSRPVEADWGALGEGEEGTPFGGLDALDAPDLGAPGKPLTEDDLAADPRRWARRG